MTKPDPMPHTPPRILIVKGRTVQAEYQDTGIPDYDGNPLIEALPPVLTDDQATGCVSSGFYEAIQRPTSSSSPTRSSGSSRAAS